ncbi:hypothetical protein BIZ38_06570 [Pseudoalteromonas sp. BZK2]|uniref:hypothetical protein n=1 Tax=Pseudoalteromonas sp. BZK2 TaxID=1904458 RepID=UPI0016548ACF|nr:hypothetical protein [Pseudoalteromonas sp. BZK2]MBC7008124.1 hypothetical protein [Pseudoalteromonas sp. BZK2]
MDVFLAWFSSPLGVAIAWVCSVVGLIYALIQQRAKNELKIKCEKLETNNYKLEQKIISIENNSTQGNQQDVKQEGKTNINTGVMNGDFNLNQ